MFDTAALLSLSLSISNHQKEHSSASQFIALLSFKMGSMKGIIDKAALPMGTMLKSLKLGNDEQRQSIFNGWIKVVVAKI